MSSVNDPFASQSVGSSYPLILLPYPIGRLIFTKQDHTAVLSVIMPHMKQASSRATAVVAILRFVLLNSIL